MSQAPQKQVPEYKVLQRSFFEPHTVEPGTHILYEGTPGNHLQPLNDAAKARMEEFYTAKFPERDMRTKELTGKQLSPREVLRPFTAEASVHHTITVTANPDVPALAQNVQSLGEIMNARKSTDQRPGPAPVPAPIAIEVKTPGEGTANG